MLSQQKIQLEIIPSDTTGALLLKNSKLSFQLKDSAAAIKKLKEFSDFWISKSYLSLGYDSLVFDSLSLKAFITIGPEIKWDSIIIDGISSNLNKKTRHGNRFIYEKNYPLQEFIKKREKIIQNFENNGFPFVQVLLDSIIFQNHFINARLKVVKNGFFIFDSIYIKGNPKISKKLLLHHIQIRKGSIYDQSKIDNLNSLIGDLSFIELIKPAEIEFKENKADLYLYLKNKPSNYFNGMLGISSNSVSDNSLQLVGDINLVLVNTLRIGEKFDFYWNRYNSSSQNLRIGFQIPYIFIVPFGVNFKIGIEKFQLDYLNTSLYAAVNYSFTGKNTIEAYLLKKNSYLINNEQNIDNGNLGFKSIIAGLTFELDKTDYRLNPGKGFFLRTSSGYGNIENSGQKNRSLIELSFEGALYLTAGKSGSIALINKSSGLITNGDFYKNQLYKIGGLNSIRGFDDQSILASAYSIFSVEPRLLLGKNSNFFLFTDLARIESNLPGTTYSAWFLGLGTGVNIDTKAGIFKLIYAIGEQNGDKLKFSNSKVHVGFSAKF